MYVMLATDYLGRLYENAETLEGAYTDILDRPKLIELPMGFLAWTGVAALAARVNARAQVLPQPTPQTILQIILEERAQAAAWPTELAKAAQLGTRWILTLMREVEGTPRLDIVAYNPDINADHWQLVGPSKRFYALMRPESFDLYHEWLERDTRVCERRADIPDTIIANAELLRELLRRYAAEPNPKSSAECTIAVHLPNGRLRTPMLAPSDTLTFL